MNAKTAKLLRKAAEHNNHAAEYEEVKLHHPGQMPAFETYERTIREMGPVSPGAPTNLRFVALDTLQRELPENVLMKHQGKQQLGYWVSRAGSRRYVVSHTIEKIRYNVDGKTPRKPLLSLDPKTGEYSPQYIIIPITRPIELKLGSSKRVYRQLKRLERTIGLDALSKKLGDEAAGAQ